MSYLLRHDVLSFTPWCPIFYAMMSYLLRHDVLSFTPWCPIFYAMMSYLLRHDVLSFTPWCPIFYAMMSYLLPLFSFKDAIVHFLMVSIDVLHPGAPSSSFSRDIIPRMHVFTRLHLLFLHASPKKAIFLLIIWAKSSSWDTSSTNNGVWLFCDLGPSLLAPYKRKRAVAMEYIPALGLIRDPFQRPIVYA